jgi:hypothetical protein
LLIYPQKLLLILRQIEQQLRASELTAKLTGENFNVFNILSLSTDEVRSHSAFIAELLNPSGSHGQDSLYLDLFLRHVKIEAHDFDSDGAHVTVEHHIGSVDIEKATGGRIDILLMDSHKHLIMIENKIYAEDQDKQLLRYHNFNKDSVLFYLTLSGDDPSSFSMGGQHFEVRKLSYKMDILEWLSECHKHSVSLPNVRETIFQYMCLIRRLTGVTTRNKVMENAKKFITENPDLLEPLCILEEAWNSIVYEVKNKFTNLKNRAIHAEYKTADGQFLIVVSTSEDVDGQYIGIGIKDPLTNKRVTDDIADKYIVLFRSLTQSQQRNAGWNIGWFNPSPFVRYQKFESLPRSLILSFYSEEKNLNDFVLGIKEQTDKIVEALRNA